VATQKNRLYYGDNLEVLQRYIKDESVDLVYLDPPFNSARITTFSSPRKTAHNPAPRFTPSKTHGNGISMPSGRMS